MMTRKMIKYLEMAIANADSPVELENRNKVIKYFNQSKGECFGYAAFWAYTRRNSDREASSDNANDANATDIDDIEFFTRVYKLLDLWDEITPFTADEIRDIERFISHVLLYQRTDLQERKKSSDPMAYKGRLFPSWDQDDLHLTMHETKRGAVTCRYRSKYYPVTLPMLTKFLAAHIHPQVIQLLGFVEKDNYGHAIGIYQDSHDKCYYAFDSRTNEMEHRCDDIDALAKLIWQNTDSLTIEMSPISMTNHVLREVRMRVYGFRDDPTYTYPNDTALRVQSADIDHILQHSPEIFRFSGEKMLHLIGAMSPLDLHKIFHHPTLTLQSKKDFVKNAFLFDNSPNLMLFARYLCRHHPDFIRTLVDDAMITLEDLNKVYNRIGNGFEVHYISQYDKNHEVDPADRVWATPFSDVTHFCYLAPDQWVEACDKNLIRPSDFAQLPRASALRIIANNPGHLPLVVLLLDHCSDKWVQEGEIGGWHGADIWFAVDEYVNAGKIEGAKLIIDRAAKNFNAAMPLEILKRMTAKDLPILEYLHKNYRNLRGYCDVIGNSYLPVIIEKLKPAKAPVIDEAVKQIDSLPKLDDETDQEYKHFQQFMKDLQYASQDGDKLISILGRMSDMSNSIYDGGQYREPGTGDVSSRPSDFNHLETLLSSCRFYCTGDPERMNQFKALSGEKLLQATIEALESKRAFYHIRPSEHGFDAIKKSLGAIFPDCRDQIDRLVMEQFFPEKPRKGM